MKSLETLEQENQHRNIPSKQPTELTGYLETFDRPWGKEKQEREYKLRCEYCNEWKWDWLITIDDSIIAKFICEDCLCNNRKKQDTERER